MTTTPRQGQPLKCKSMMAGFGLLEMLIVAVVVCILVWKLGSKLGGPLSDAQAMTARGDIEFFSAALDDFKKDCEAYPSTEQGLQALIVKPPSCTNWKGPYLKEAKIKNDPWGSKYIYKCPGVKTASSFDLCSPGPDKIEGNNDDICNMF